MYVAYLERGRTVDHVTYIESTLKPLVEPIKKVTPIPKFEYQRTFNKWMERMGLCIKYEGDYYEHFIK
jgi:hypothetical protein